MMNHDSVEFSQTFLNHHGIKGQKWGVRRYQNPDGSLTSAGEKRYSDAHLPKKRLNQEIAKLSNEDLRVKAERLELENRYRNAYANAHPSLKKKIAAGIVTGIVLAGVQQGGQEVIRKLVTSKEFRNQVLSSGGKAALYMVNKMVKG